MKRVNINETLVIVLVYIFCFIFLLKVFNYKNAELIVYILSLPPVLVLFFTNLKNINRKLLVLLFFVIMISIINVGINQTINSIPFSLSYYKKLMMFILSIIFICTTYSLDISIGKIKKHIIITNSIIIIALIIMFVFKHDQMYMLNGKNYNSLVFNFTNPNLTALFLLGIFIFEYSFMLKYKGRKSLKFFLLLFSVITMAFIILTNSRTQLLASFVLILLSIFYKKTDILKNKIICFIIASFPLLFVLGYIIIMNNNFFVQFLKNISIFKIALDSRYSIWMYTISCFSSSPIFGAYNLIGMGQMHNTHLDVLTSYGVIPFVLFLYLLTTIIHDKGNKSRNYIYMYGFIAFIMSGNGEAALFSGSSGLYIYFGLILLFAKNDIKIIKGEKI